MMPRNKNLRIELIRSKLSDIEESVSLVEANLPQTFEEFAGLGLIKDGNLLCTMQQNPDVMGKEGVKAAVRALEGEELGGAVSDTGVSVLKKN